jgi:hypothetical protein
MDNGQKESIKKLANGIREHFKKYKTYTFRPVRIDGVYCYPVIHRKTKIVNFESIHVICYVDIGNSKKMTQKYSLIYKKYKTIENAVEIVENIVANYKIYNGDLVNPNDYELLKLEENIIPYEEHQKCCVCLENTQETTTCKHYICFHCRDKCLSMQTPDCPICRKPGVMRIFNIDNNLINNDEYVVLRDAIDYEYSSESSSESENSEQESSSENSEQESIEAIEHREEQETIFDHIVYHFPIFSTPNIFASPSTDSFEEMITFPVI